MKIEVCNCCNSEEVKLFMKPKCYVTNVPLNAAKCSNCGLVFLSPRPDPQLGLDYFNKAYAGTDDEMNPGYFQNHERKFLQSQKKLKFIESLVNLEGKSILDIGTGLGHFLKVAQDNGLKIFGTELSVEARKKAKELFNITLQEDFTTFPSESFDIITLWDVMEHVTDPKSIFDHVFRLLKPGGHLVIETVNVNSIEFMLLREKWDLWHIDHNYYYTIDTLKKYLDAYDFNNIQFLKGQENTKKLPRTIKQVLSKYAKNPEKVVTEIKRRALLKKFPGNEYDYCLLISAQKDA